VTLQHENSGITVRALTEGALMAAVAALLGIIGIYLPVLALFTNLFWAIPIILVIMRQNMRLGVMSLVVAGALISLLAGPVQGLLLIVNLGGMALAYGYCFRHRLSPLRALLIGTVTAALSTAATFILSSAVANLPLNQFLVQINQVMDETFKIYREMGVLDKMLPPGMTAQQYQQQMMDMLRLLLPGLFIAAAMAMALINYLIARKILIRLKYEIPPMPAFRDWHFPWYVVWGVILALACWLAGRYLEMPVLTQIGQNILYIYSFLLLISGLSVIVYFWHHHGLAPAMKAVAIIGFLMFFAFSIYFLMMVGLFDPLFDYRRFAKARPPAVPPAAPEE